jgi:small subunit ribosomal protein S6
MPSYELLFILRPDLDEETTEAAITRVLTQIGDLGGTVESVDRWGKRRLAYLINDYREGVYTVVKLHAPAGATAELERNLKLAPEVMRYLVTKLET